MGGRKIDYHLMDAILDLLYVLQDYGITMEQLMNHEVEKDLLSELMDMPNISTAYEVVRFMDEMPGGFLIYCADDSEEIIYANQALLRIFQCDTLQEFLEYTGNSFAGIVHPEDLEEVEKSIWEQIDTSQYDLDYVEYRITRKDGAIRWIEDYGHFIHTEGLGDLFYVFLSDATEKMERQSRERERLLCEQKAMLEEALNNANLAIRAKNAFLSNMSHDMRTPLNAMFGYTALAKKYIDDKDRVSHYLKEIDFAGRSLLDQIDKVLEISWTEADEEHIIEAECNLTDIVQDIQNTILPRATKKEIRFELDTSELKHPDVYADMDKLRQAVLHLASNGVEYTENGGRVSLRVTEAESLNGYAEYQFIVADNGIGIGEDFLEHIFEPFERENNTTFSGVYGTGLGLTIAKNFVKRMGGNIQVESVPGEGSTFTITLRLHIQEQPLVSNVDIEKIVSHLEGQKVLLVEDNEINQEIEKEILEGMGFHIEIAENGEIAVDKVKNSQPGEYGLILMDVQMPVMNGREATETIRGLENRELAGIPIIALSADAYESDKRKSIESGMHAHLTKPMDVSLLLETMASIWNE